jgi:hypothetical protein
MKLCSLGLLMRFLLRTLISAFCINFTNGFSLHHIPGGFQTRQIAHLSVDFRAKRREQTPTCQPLI